MDVNYINPFINASMAVFSTFAGVKSDPGSPSVQKRPLADRKINGFIGLNGHGISGYFIISFSASFLTKILAGIFEDQFNPSREDLYDLAGEITNMITGSAKAELSQKGFFFDVAVPRIDLGNPTIPEDLVKNPVIVVPFVTRIGKFNIQASIQRIEEDFQQDNMPEIKAPKGYVSVDAFAKSTHMDPVKVRRLLKTGFLSGEKISSRQWHIPEDELMKIQGFRPPKKQASTQKLSGSMLEEAVSVNEFSGLSGLSSAKIKNFLRTGFLKGALDDHQAWRIWKGQVSKFKKRG